MSAPAGDSSYVPALGLDWLTRFYDPLIRLALREDAFKRSLVTQAGLRPGHDVLDLGCGTATLTVMLKAACPDARVTGIDGDPAILDIARTKTAGLAIELRQAMAYELPYAPATFDRVVSSLVFHHLADADKARTLSEVHRVLRPGGELHVADWGAPANPLMWIAALGVRLLDGAERTRANLEGRLPDLMRAAGLADVAEAERWSTPFGTLSLYRATRP